MQLTETEIQVLRIKAEDYQSTGLAAEGMKAYAEAVNTVAPALKLVAGRLWFRFRADPNADATL